LDESKSLTDEGLLAHLEAFSELTSLGHSRQRLEELAPKVAELLDTIRRLRSVDVEGYEMAVNYETWLPSR
jgi:hypothetical protein